MQNSLSQGVDNSWETYTLDCHENVHGSDLTGVAKADENPLPDLSSYSLDLSITMTLMYVQPIAIQLCVLKLVYAHNKVVSERGKF